MQRPRTLSILAAVLSVVVVAGCGDDDDSGSRDAHSEASPSSEVKPVDQAELLSFPLDIGQPGRSNPGPYGPPDSPADLGKPPVPCNDDATGWPGEPRAWLASDAFGPVEEGSAGSASDSRRLVVYADVAAAKSAYEKLWSGIEACHRHTIGESDATAGTDPTDGGGTGPVATQPVTMREPKVGDDAVAWWYGAGEMANPGTIVITRAGTAVLSIAVGEQSTATDIEDRADARARDVVAKICAEDWAGCAS